VTGIPVKLHRPDAMLTVTEGLLAIRERRLVLEFQTKDDVFGVYRTDVETVEFLPDEVAAITFRKRLFGAEITIQAHSMQALEDVPGARQGQIRLKVRRRDRAQAQQLAEFLQQRLHELALEPGAETSGEFE
jgi:hypothetical protein